MSNSGAGAMAEGIQAGWGMGVQSDQLQQQKLRADQEFGLRSRAADLQARTADREDQDFGLKQAQAQLAALTARRDQIGSVSQHAKAAGLPEDPSWGDQWNTVNGQISALQAKIGGVTAPAPGPITPPAGGGTGLAPAPAPQPAVQTPEQAHVAAVDQHVADLSSKLKTGQLALSEVDPADLAMMVTASTGRPPSQVGQIQQGLQDWHAGMETSNQGLIIRGLNTVYQPQLQQGVGDASPHGGHIVKKEIIGLDPAASADGSVHTDKVIPRLRITTDVKGPDGQPLHYDAPMTEGRSTDPNDPVKAISVQGAMEQLGQLGTLASALQHPEVAAAAAKGEAQAKPQIDQYLAYKAMTTPANPAIAKEQQVQDYMKQYGVDRDTAISQMGDTGAVPYHATRGPAALLESARELAAEEGITVTQALARLHPSRYSGGVDIAKGKYNPGGGVAPAGGAAPAGGGGTGTGTGLGGAPAKVPTGASGAPLTPEQFLAKLSPEDRQSVLTVARDSDTLKGISMAHGRREHVQNLAQQYLDLQGASGVVSLGKGNTGIDAQGHVVNATSPETVDFYATRSLAGDDSWKAGLSRGPANQKLMAAVSARVPELAKNLGLAPQDVGTNKATNAALTKTLADRTKYVTAVDQLQGTLTRQGELVKSLLAKGGATSGGPLFNAPYNAVRKALGSTDAQALDAALVGLAREHQRVIVSPLSNGQLAVSAQTTGDRLANLNLTPQQIIHTIDDVMAVEARNAHEQGHQTLEDVRTQLRSLGKPAAPAASAAPAKAAPERGTITRGFRFKGGDPASPNSWEKV